tara:strand:- start:1182 stop:1328 length:147 start_codon:yes stop_codon:yes gene_type:complete
MVASTLSVTVIEDEFDTRIESLDLSSRKIDAGLNAMFRMLLHQTSISK